MDFLYDAAWHNLLQHQTHEKRKTKIYLLDSSPSSCLHSCTRSDRLAFCCCFYIITYIHICTKISMAIFVIIYTHYRRWHMSTENGLVCWMYDRDASILSSKELIYDECENFNIFIYTYYSLDILPSSNQLSTFVVKENEQGYSIVAKSI